MASHVAVVAAPSGKEPAPICRSCCFIIIPCCCCWFPCCCIYDCSDTCLKLTLNIACCRPFWPCCWCIRRRPCCIRVARAIPLKVSLISSTASSGMSNYVTVSMATWTGSSTTMWKSNFKFCICPCLSICMSVGLVSESPYLTPYWVVEFQSQSSGYIGL